MLDDLVYEAHLSFLVAVNDNGSWETSKIKWFKGNLQYFSH